MRKIKDFCGAICFITLTVATILSIIWTKEFYYVTKQETASPEEDEEDVEEYDE